MATRIEIKPIKVAEVLYCAVAGESEIFQALAGFAGVTRLGPRSLTSRLRISVQPAKSALPDGWL